MGILFSDPLKLTTALPATSVGVSMTGWIVYIDFIWLLPLAADISVGLMKIVILGL